MNLSFNWLHDYIDTDKITDTKKYCDRMTDTGSKVEGFEVLAGDVTNVKIGKVVAMERHPDSDHLWICRIDVGAEAPIQIVTGAQNVFVGAIVPAAVAPATLPEGKQIKAGKLRGVDSNGMLCSFGELGLTSHDCPGKEENGIWILDECYGQYLGQDVCDCLLIRDTVVEFEITSNRPDCLSVIGLARETAASMDLEWHVPPVSVKGTQDGDHIDNYISVGISAPDLCYRYAAKVVKNVKIAPSPDWMRMRLRAAGVRPINNIVDITNYVMLEYGQPMHAFDYKQIEGKAINVRRAGDGEVFVSLDNISHTLDSSMLVIADRNKACALAGVMGGLNSEIENDTVTVVFESACFSGPDTRVTAKKNGMRTESSARFEKGLDPENCLPGLMRACQLVEMLGAGDVVDGLIDVYPGKKEQTILPFTPEKYNKFLGTEIDEQTMIDILATLECRVENGNIYVPSFRSDLNCMQDIAEEIVRIWGYDKIPSSCIKAETTQGMRTPKQKLFVATEQLMYGMGISQIQTFSFISPKYYDAIALPADSTLRTSVVISNPLGEDTSVMRTTALPSLLEVLQRNNNFSNQNVRLFEMATIYLPNADSALLPEEKTVVTVGMYGDADFYDMKGAVENLLKMAGIKAPVYTACTENPSYHPGRCATVTTADGKYLGVFGQIHPVVADNYGMNIPVLCAEIDFDALFEVSNTEPDYKPLPKFPAATRDYAFVCAEELEVGKIMSVIAKAGGALVEKVELFDIFRGEKLGAGNKSVAFRVTLRAADRTLTVEEADKISKQIINDLKFKLGIALRA